ncbi:MAG: hypothetical protein AUI63_03405 [Gemmatimonadetes bacterium 13_1_40CM_2_60_3]|nr:MAG: hypothetical protein AUI63_03405 [Gemmatimonadetes bacterium 13_1_40CM_2_60_3]
MRRRLSASFPGIGRVSIEGRGGALKPEAILTRKPGGFGRANSRRPNAGQIDREINDLMVIGRGLRVGHRDTRIVSLSHGQKLRGGDERIGASDCCARAARHG